MIKFVIVNNNINERTKINKIIISKMMSNKILFKIHEFDCFNDELKDYINKDKGNSIFFVDLNSPSCSNLDIIKYVRYEKNDWVTPFIYFDKSDKYSIQVLKSKLYILDLIVNSNNMNISIYENIDICIKMLNFEKFYRYTYKNVEYIINLSSINYIQRDGRKTKIVTTGETYYQNISLTEIKKYLSDNFIVSSKGVIINKNNILKIDWNNLKVYFKDGNSFHIVSLSHRKEIEKLLINS